MKTRFFFAATGEYLGGFNEGAIGLVPENAIEVAEPPASGLDRMVDGVVVPTDTRGLNEKLEEAFLLILPSHLGQPYLTDSVIAGIMQAKVAVIDANKIDATGFLARAVIRGLTLPSELETDRTTLLNLIPEN